MNIDIFRQRRERFMPKISNGIAIFGSAKPCRHRYRQDSNLYYLTGFKEPEAVLVLAPEHAEHKSILFVRPTDRAQEIWTGKRAGVDGAKEQFGFDATYSVADLENTLPKYCDNIEKIYYSIGNDDNLDKKVLDLLKREKGKRYDSLTGISSLVEVGEIVRDMRMIKDEYEIELIRKSAQISSEAHINAMKSIKPGMYEYEMQAIIEYTFLKNGAEPSYASIVATSTNAICLHYDANNCQIKDGDLMLLDAGCEYERYSSDITRTFPANGKFSSVQKDLYNIVLEAQLSAIEMVKTGQVVDGYNDKVIQVIVDGLMNMGLLKGERDKIMEEKSYNKFYMHGAGHWLGLDTHDVGSRKIGNDKRTFEPGMIVTVEPGLYIADDLEDIDEKYKGIGIRIEDNVLVTENGNEVLTSAVPKTIDDIEALMR
jgi:Xaa-Pro aminopeptidase